MLPESKNLAVVVVVAEVRVVEVVVVVVTIGDRAAPMAVVPPGAKASELDMPGHGVLSRKCWEGCCPDLSWIPNTIPNYMCTVYVCGRTGFSRFRV